MVLLNGPGYGGNLRIVAKETEEMGLFSLSHVMRDMDGGAGRSLGCTALIVKPREPQVCVLHRYSPFSASHRSAPGCGRPRTPAPVHSKIAPACGPRRNSPSPR